jgi:hypothetical protein
MTPIRDLRRDWRRWSVLERVCATLLAGLWVVGVTTAILADAQASTFREPAPATGTSTRERSRPIVDGRHFQGATRIEPQS